MSLTFTAEQDDLRAAVRRFLIERNSPVDVRRLITDESGFDPSCWATVAELGLTGIAIADRYDGSGGGAIELGVVLEEMGRSLLSGPYFAAVVLAGQALTGCGTDDAKRRWLPSIARGELTATLALAEGVDGWQSDDVHVQAVRHGDSWSLTGSDGFVVDGHTADLLLVLARTETGPGLFAIDRRTDECGPPQPHAARFDAVRLDALDLTRRLARVTLADAAAVRVDATGADLPRLFDLIAVAAAAEQLGGAQHCLDASVDYAKTRVQFGRPIGTFQAIKHTCADMLLAVESARSAVYYAMSVAADGPADELAAAASLAQTWASDTFTAAAKQMIQIHGGIGFTWEHDAHLYLRRAKTAQLMFGTPAEHTDRFADLVGI